MNLARRIVASVLCALPLAAAIALLTEPRPAPAQIPGTANIQVGGTNILGGTSGRCLFDNAGKVGETASCGLAGGITIGTSVITGGTNGRILYDNAAVVGELVTGTGVATALGVNTGSAGAFVVNGGALGTPASGLLTNATGLPIGGIAGLGTNQSTFLAAALTVNGALKLNGSGTPSQAACADLSNGTTNCSAAVGQLPGTTTNDSASAGNVGEVLTQSATSVSLVTNTSKTVTSKSITAGDWDLWCVYKFTPASTTVLQALLGEPVLVDNTLALVLGNWAEISYGANSVASGTRPVAFSTPLNRVSIASPTTYFCVASAEFNTSTLTVDAILVARRRR